MSCTHRQLDRGDDACSNSWHRCLVAHGRRTGTERFAGRVRCGDSSRLARQSCRRASSVRHFPARTVRHSRRTTSGIRRSRRCPSMRTARHGSPRWHRPRRTCTRTTVRPANPRAPYGIPWTVVRKATVFTHVTFQYASESNRRPYPLTASTPIEGGSDRHALMVDPYRSASSAPCTLFETWDTYYHAGESIDGRFRRHVEPAIELAATGGLYVRRRRRTPDLARTRQLQ